MIIGYKKPILKKLQSDELLQKYENKSKASHTRMGSRKLLLKAVHKLTKAHII